MDGSSGTRSDVLKEMIFKNFQGSKKEKIN